MGDEENRLTLLRSIEACPDGAVGKMGGTKR